MNEQNTGRNGLSVVVATYNRPELLRRVCDALRSQVNETVEIIVVDDGSNPRADVPCDRYLWRPDDGFHKTWCMNQGVQMASFDFLAFLDDDTVPEKACWAATHLKMLREFKVVRAPYAMALYDGDKLKSLMPSMYGTRPHYFASTNTSMHKNLFHQLGGFDMLFDGHYGYEDIDLGLTLANHQVRIGYANKDAFAMHLGESYCDDGNGGMDSSPADRNKDVLYEKWGDRAETLELNNVPVSEVS